GEVGEVLVAREPDLAALGGVDLGVVPQQTPRGVGTAALRRAHEAVTVDGVGGQAHSSPPGSRGARGGSMPGRGTACAVPRDVLGSFARSTAVYGRTTAPTAIVSEAHTGTRPHVATVTTNSTRRAAIWMT